VLSHSAGLSGTRPSCRDTELFPLVETQPCPCARYTVQPTGPWLDCLLEGEGVSSSVTANGRVAIGVCGAGSRFRRTECLDVEGNLVEPRYITWHFGYVFTAEWTGCIMFIDSVKFASVVGSLTKFAVAS
jgi:hypothetical protein